MSFSADVSRFATKAKANMDTVVRRATFELSNTLIFKTAVDTGLLRSNWQIGQDMVPTGTLPIGQSPAPAQAMTLNAGHIAWITNNLPYAMPILEFGHSKQTPPATARIAVKQVQAKVDEICRGLA